MRKLLLTFIITICFFCFSHAQFNKGSYLLGGELSYNSSSDTGNIALQYANHKGNFVISLGRALNESAVLGINLSYSPSSNSTLYFDQFGNAIQSKIKNYMYGAGVFYRKYKSLGNQFYFYGQMGVNYGFFKSTADYDGMYSSSSTSQIVYGDITPGISYKVSKKFFLELSIPGLFFISYGWQGSQYNTNSGHSFAISTNLSSNPLQYSSLGFRLNL